MKPEHFQWSAYDPNQWNHYYHAGVQQNAYRVSPRHLAGAGCEPIEPRWVDRLFRFFKWIGA